MTTSHDNICPVFEFPVIALAARLGAAACHVWTANFTSSADTASYTISSLGSVGAWNSCFQVNAFAMP